MCLLKPFADRWLSKMRGRGSMDNEGEGLLAAWIGVACSMDNDAAWIMRGRVVACSMDNEGEGLLAAWIACSTDNEGEGLLAAWICLQHR
jgi:hypothetical protein